MYPRKYKYPIYFVDNMALSSLSEGRTSFPSAVKRATTSGREPDETLLYLLNFYVNCDEFVWEDTPVKDVCFVL